MKSLVVFFCLFCYTICLAQSPADSIRTEADIEVFVKQYGEQHWPEITKQFFVFLKDDYRAEERGDPDSSLYVKWIVEDFNNDGKKDLLFSNIRKYKSASQFFSLVSNVDGKYDSFSLWKGYNYYYTFDFDYQKKDSNTLLYLRQNKIAWKDTIPIRFILSDTLMVAQGGFVERPEKRYKQRTFDTIIFQFSYFPLYRDLMPLPQGMRLTIAKTGAVIYEEDGNLYHCIECYDNKTEGIHTTATMQLSAAELQRLKDLVSLSGLKKTYYLDSSGGFHQDRAVIKIKTGKKAITITDDGLQGSFWLRLLYTKMFALSKRFRTDMARYFQQNHFEYYY